METKTLNLEIGKEYILSNKERAVFSGYDNEELVFISRTIAPNWFRYYYIPEADALFKGNEIKSKNIRGELKYHPQVLEQAVRENMRNQLSRILNTQENVGGALTAY